MKIDVTLPTDVTDGRKQAAQLESDGYDGIWMGETKQDPFLVLLQAAEATERALVGTSVAIAFGRTPLTMAQVAFDLARYSQGRFVLGLGSQIRPHIERRYSMPWSKSAARMREYVLALRAIWASWQLGEKLDFNGEFYTHNLMPPFFSPASHPYGPPPVHLAGVGERMTEVAGEVADGYIAHPFTTRQYVEQVTLPCLARGREQGGHPGLEGFPVRGVAFVTMGSSDEELAQAIRLTKRQIAFYASTPAYRAVLELHGRGELQPELTSLSKQGKWEEMGTLIDDELLNLISVVGDPQSVGREVARRWGGLFDRISLYSDLGVGTSTVLQAVAAIRKATEATQ